MACDSPGVVMAGDRSKYEAHETVRNFSPIVLLVLLSWPDLVQPSMRVCSLRLT